MRMMMWICTPFNIREDMPGMLDVAKHLPLDCIPVDILLNVFARTAHNANATRSNQEPTEKNADRLAPPSLE